jgi:hypothetical protein
VVRILGARGNRDHVTAADRDHLAGHAQRALALEHDEHLFLRIVEVVWAGPLAGRHDVDAATDPAARQAFAGSDQAGAAAAVVQRRAVRGLELDLVEVADQLAAQFFAHDDLTEGDGHGGAGRES